MASTAVDRGHDVASTAVRKGQDVASTAVGRGQDVAATAVGKGQEVADLATRDVRHLAEAVKAEAVDVSEELWAQTRQLARETKVEVQDQAESQTRRLADSLEGLGCEVRALVEGRPEEAPTVGTYFSTAADHLEDLAEQVRLRGAGGLVEDLEDFARRKPGAFLVGAVIAGFGVGRFLRAAKADSDETTPSIPAQNGRAAPKRLAAAGAR